VILSLFGRTGWLADFPVRVAFNVNGMLLATVFVSLPFMIREVMPVLAAMTPEQEEAATTLGASAWLRFRRIVFPAIRHAALFGIVLAFARAIGEFGASSLIGGAIQGTTETATLFIQRSLQDRHEVAAYSMSLTLMIFALLMLFLMNFLRRTRTAA
jgi:sulfate/thiosulfate transport system permease protein